MANGREMTAVVRAPRKCHEMGQKKKRKRMAVNLKWGGTSGARVGHEWERAKEGEWERGRRKASKERTRLGPSTGGV